MKVLHVYRTFFPDTHGGLEQTIKQICSNSAQHGVTSRVLTLSTDPTPQELTYEGIEVVRAKQDAEIASCSMSLEAFALHEEHARWADIINYHFPWPFADVLSLRSFIAKPKVITYHSDIVRQKLLLTAYRPVHQRTGSCAPRPTISPQATCCPNMIA